MVLAIPPGIPANASWRTYYLPTMANPAVPSIATDLGGASAIDITNILVKGGMGLDVAVEKWKDERFGTTDVFEQNGATTWSVQEITYVIDPQTPTSATNKLYAAVKDGGSGYLVVRMGMSADAALAASQKVWVAPVSFAPAVPLPPEANTMSRAKQSVSVTGTVYREVSLAA